MQPYTASNRIMRVATLPLVACALLLVAPAAPAFYNPQTGRWLNRDPIEERGGYNLQTMVNNNPVSQVDVDGRTTFKLRTFDKDECGWAHAIWGFTLDSAAPCDGYFVQKVTLQRRRRFCGYPGDYAYYSETAWEIWPFKVSKDASQSAEPLADSFKLSQYSQSDGTMITLGVMRFVCERDFGNDQPLKWPTGKVLDGIIDTGILPHAKTKPAWWSKGFEEASHSLTSNWVCCCSPQESQAKATPE
jgi:hypothetical protein